MGMWKLAFRLHLLSYCLIYIRGMGADDERMDEQAEVDEDVM